MGDETIARSACECKAKCDAKDKCKTWTYNRKPVKKDSGERKKESGKKIPNCVLRKTIKKTVKHFDNVYVSGLKIGNEFSSTT